MGKREDGFQGKGKIMGEEGNEVKISLLGLFGAQNVQVFKSGRLSFLLKHFLAALPPL